ANIGQSGKVWFLAGTTTSGITKRTITIPAGTALFFPIVNYFWLNLPELPAPYADPVWSPKQEAYVRDYLAGVVDTATGLSLKVDGRTLKNPEDFRFQSNPPVMVYVPQDDIFNLTKPFSQPDPDLPPTSWGLKPGSYGPSVADGYWVLLPPLSAGPHTIQFTGGFTGFSLDVTYKVTVKSNHHNGHVNPHNGHDD
ncbi:MAG: hypothetical protein ACOYMG_13050, partial [Candidatus Methylumidiphilus sp.]